MSDQFGFDFGGDSAEPFTVYPAGTWLAPTFTASDWLVFFCKAETAVQRITGPGRCLFRQGIEAAKVQHAKAGAGGYRICRSQFEPTADELSAFIKHCYAMDGTNHAAIEFKTRREALLSTVAMYAPDTGTVMVRQWLDAGIGVEFYPWRAPFFLDSYRDQLPVIYAPRSLWAVAYCADKLAYADTKIASVSPFALHGREYINDGSFGRGSYWECEGWTFRPLADWRGPTFNYRTQCLAWDDGCRERGDRRGLVVRVRGQDCVLDGAARIYDDKATGPMIFSDEGADIDADVDGFVDDESESLDCCD